MGEGSIRELMKNRRIAMAAGDDELAAFEVLRLIATPVFFKRGNPVRVFKLSIPAMLRYDLKARALLLLEEAIIADPACAGIAHEMRDLLENSGTIAPPFLKAAKGGRLKSSTRGEWIGWFAWRPVKLLEGGRPAWMGQVMRRRVASIAGKKPYWEYTRDPARFPAKRTGAELLASWH